MTFDEKVEFLRQHKEIVKLYKEVEQSIKEALQTGLEINGVALKTYRKGKPTYKKGLSVQDIYTLNPLIDPSSYTRQELVKFDELPITLQEQLKQAGLTENTADAVGVVLC